MDHLPAPPRARWRRLQLSRWLIEYDGHRLDDCEFDAAGSLMDFGLPRARLEAAIASGVPFRTSGCPGRERPDVSACDRPYGDGPPSDIRSYPFAPRRGDLRRIRHELAESLP